MKKILLVLSMSSLFLSCGERKTFRSPTPGFGFTSRERQIDEESMEYQMKIALLTSDDEERYNKVEELLKKGADPNKKAGQFKWIDTNPLWNNCRNIKLLKIFLIYGADIKKRPYIAKSLSSRILATKNPIKEWEEFHNKNPQMAVIYECEIYECVKFLLENGANPNMKCAGNKVLLIPTDWNYRRYNEKYGKSAINLCIEQNLLSVYSLLLEYGVELDKKSLELAEETTERTGSSEMEELVKRQWERQSATAAHKRRPGK
ncbi:MAG: hypothetical protein K2O09_04655 [Treponemataceae bacterium]|nr:hypothetical protein [Treponemataceae bacterium]